MESDLQLGATGDGAWPAGVAVWLSQLLFHYWQLVFLVFSAFVLYILLVSPIQSVYVLLKFY
jgi:hypothetical protein